MLRFYGLLTNICFGRVFKRPGAAAQSLVLCAYVLVASLDSCTCTCKPLFKLSLLERSQKGLGLSHEVDNSGKVTLIEAGDPDP